MEIVLIIVSILLIAVVLLQAGKVDESNIITGGSTALFKNRKERGFELFLSRVTLALGILFFVICLIMSVL